MSNGGATTEPPSFAARSAVASASSTQRSTLQLGGPSAAGIITATVSRDTGCSGSPPTKPGSRNIVACSSPISKLSVVQPKTVP